MVSCGLPFWYGIAPCYFTPVGSYTQATSAISGVPINDVICGGNTPPEKWFDNASNRVKSLLIVATYLVRSRCVATVQVFQFLLQFLCSISTSNTSEHVTCACASSRTSSHSRRSAVSNAAKTKSLLY